MISWPWFVLSYLWSLTSVPQNLSESETRASDCPKPHQGQARETVQATQRSRLGMSQSAKDLCALSSSGLDRCSMIELSSCEFCLLPGLNPSQNCCSNCSFYAQCAPHVVLCKNVKVKSSRKCSFGKTTPSCFIPCC